ncbi:MAG: tyrosine-type recombinase/integrase, partial [bacterium]|nr:tyrosine-type recombinase/integrase [bacterium]
MASIFKRGGKGRYQVSWYDHKGKRRTKSSGTTDHRAAERIATELEAQAALRREGVVDPRHDRFATENSKPLSRHVGDYIAHCGHVGHADRHVSQKERHLTLLFQEAELTKLFEITTDPVEQNLRTLREAGLSARTVNFRRQIVVAFVNWLVRVGRMESNPLKNIPKLDEGRDRRRVRRALSEEELARLLDVAESRGRRTWYLAAVLAGLRKGDLRRLRWRDLDLDRGLLVVRGGKAKREDVLPLHPQLAEEFRSIKPRDVLPSAPVFTSVVTDRTRQSDFTRAGIALRDDEGRVVDLHALRTTLGTRLAREGVAPQVGQQIMRHADYRTTLKHYTALTLSDTAAAMNHMPGVAAPRSRNKARATGTTGEKAQPECQQNRQQSVIERERAAVRVAPGDQQRELRTRLALALMVRRDPASRLGRGAG